MEAYKIVSQKFNICLIWITCTIFELSSAETCDYVITCENPTDFCCGRRCCDHESYIDYRNNLGDFSDDTFVKTGLKSALVLLIMSSAVFLVCFCIMKCCRRTMSRPSDSQDQAAVRRGQLSFLSISRQHGARHPQFQLLRLRPQTSPPTQIIVDEPPSYNEVMGTIREDTPEALEDEATSRSDVEEKPPEYSSIVNKVEI